MTSLISQPEKLLILLTDNGLATLQMVFVSGFIGLTVGLPLGILLHLSKKNQILAHPTRFLFLDTLVNLGRSIPFLILMISIIPFTRWLVGTSIGTSAAIVPLAIASIPYMARLIESALIDVPSGLIEAAQSMGATPLQIIKNILIPEALPSIINNTTIMLVTLVSYSTMAGTVGGGGLGDVAIRYGYERYDPPVMFITVVILVLLVQIIQTLGQYLVRKVDHR